MNHFAPDIIRPRNIFTAERCGIKDTATVEEKEARFQRFVGFINRRGYNFVPINNIITMRDGSKYVNTKSGALVHAVDVLEPTVNYGK